MKYPSPLQMCVKAGNPPLSSSLTLTSSFGKKIYSNELIKIDDDYSSPLVQVLSSSSRSKNSCCCQIGKEEWVLQVTMSVLDCDDIVLDCKLTM